MRTLADMTEPELTTYFNMLAQAVEDILPGGPSKKGRCLFALLVFDESKIGQYVSNAERADIIKVLRETADRLERREDWPRDREHPVCPKCGGSGGGLEPPMICPRCHGSGKP